MERVFRSIIYLNIDVLVGALVNCLLFGKMLNVGIPFPILGILGLTVWQIYTFDRLVDVTKNPEAKSKRHQFHLDHFYTLVVLLIISFVISAILLFWVPLITIKWGGALLLITLSYFISIHFLPIKKVYHKELIVAFVYVTGTVLGPLSLVAGSVSFAFIGVFICFYLLALLNLLIFSYNDRNFDKQSNFPSIVNRLGPSRMQGIITGIGLFYFLFLCATYWMHLIPAAHVLMYFFMGVTLFALHYRWNPHYRWIGDMVFLFPVFMLL